MKNTIFSVSNQYFLYNFGSSLISREFLWQRPSLNEIKKHIFIQIDKMKFPKHRTTVPYKHQISLQTE